MESVAKKYIFYFHSDNNESIVFDLNLYSFLIKACLQNRNMPSSYLKGISSCFAVNTLIEFLNHWFYTVSEIERVGLRFSREKQL